MGTYLCAQETNHLKLIRINFSEFPYLGPYFLPLLLSNKNNISYAINIFKPFLFQQYSKFLLLLQTKNIFHCLIFAWEICLLHSVLQCSTVWKKREIHSHRKNISLNPLFSTFSNRKVAFTKFLSKKCESKFTSFPHCVFLFFSYLTQ